MPGRKRARGEPLAPPKPTHHLILLLLAEAPTYGVELLERLETRSKGAIRLNAGSLYRIIAQLVDGGFIEALGGVSSAGRQGAPRKQYAVTPLGRRVIQEEAQRQAELLDMARSLDLVEEA